MQTIDITVPRGWHELTQRQLRYLFFLISEGYSNQDTLPLPLVGASCHQQKARAVLPAPEQNRVFCYGPADSRGCNITRLGG